MTGRGQLRPNVALGAIGSKAPIADRGGLKRGRQQSTLCSHPSQENDGRVAAARIIRLPYPREIVWNRGKAC